MNRLRLLGLNHTTAALEVRERLAVDSARQRDAMEALRQEFGPCEVVILSTCNRMELYVARPVSPPNAHELTAFLAKFNGVQAELFAAQLYEKAGREAAQHLFSVAASLDSMVLGETQIIGQVRLAYDAAREMGATGALLNPLFQRALAVGKQVHSETSIAEGRLSVVSIAVNYARGIFDHFDDKTVLCIGAGKMSTLVIRHFTELGPGKLLVCNRDPQKARVLAERFGGEAVPFHTLEEQLIRADIIVTSTAASEPIITRSMFESLLRRRRYRSVFIIDLAVPRDVEAAVGELDNVYLYNVDDLQKVVAETAGQRGGAVAEARAIVQRQVEEFATWLQRRELGPAIEQLYSRYHALAREELHRAMAKMPALDEQARLQLEEMTRRIVNKVLHDPVTAFKHGDAMHGPAQQYLHAMEKLFKLDEMQQDNTGEKS
jgi:glutamyl-tRNA reductase